MMEFSTFIKSKFVSILLTLALVSVILVNFVLDRLLLGQLEQLASKVNGSEVAIGSLETHLFKSIVELRGIEIRNSHSPERNILEIGELHLPLSISSLFYGKFIFDKAVLQNVKFDSRRKNLVDDKFKPNAALKESLSIDASGIDGMASDDLKKAVELLLDQNLEPLLSLANWEKLPSNILLSSAGLDLAQLKESQQRALANMPSADILSQYMRSVEAMKVPKDSEGILAGLSELESIEARVLGYYGQMIASNSSIRVFEHQFLNRLATFKTLEALDLAMVRENNKFLNFDLKTSAAQVPYREIEPFLRPISSFYALLDPSLDDSVGLALPKEGKISFLKKERYNFDLLPKFWIKNLQIESTDQADPECGNLVGSISNLRNYPGEVKATMRAELTGGFKQKKIEGINFKASFDHRKNSFDDFLLLKIGAFPIQQQSIVSSKDYTLGLNEASGSLDLQMYWQNEAIKLKFELNQAKLQWVSSAQTAALEEFLAVALAPLTEANVSVLAEGTWQALNWTSASTLANRLQETYHAALSKKVELNRIEIEEAILQRIRSNIENFKAQVQIKDQAGSLQHQAARLVEIIHLQQSKFKLSLASSK